MEQTSQPKDQSLEHPSNTKGEEPAPNHQETGVETESKEAALTRKQKENLKKKQKKKQKKAQTKDAEDEEDKDQDEPEKQEEPVKEQTDGDKEGEKSEASTEPVSDFQAELEWCIKQIRLGLASNAVSKDQLKESVDVLSVLESNKAPLPKKRHLMRVVFGDYRSMMKNTK